MSQYNLRPRGLCVELRDKEEGEALDDVSGDEIDHMSDESEYPTSGSDSDENELDMENASLQQRLMEAQPRGRPSIIRRGKNGYKWSINPPGRQSGT